MQNRLTARGVRRFGLLALLLSGQFGWACHTMAAQIRVTDADGLPLANAVLLVEGVPPRAEDSYVMDQIDRQFVPHTLVVPVGAQVDFPTVMMCGITFTPSPKPNPSSCACSRAKRRHR